jgi:hypothetical protein
MGKSEVEDSGAIGVGMLDPARLIMRRPLRARRISKEAKKNVLQQIIKATKEVLRVRVRALGGR